MKNPFLKKNPLLSMWLSAAHGMAHHMRRQATALAKRQSTAAVTALLDPAKPRKRRKP